MDLVGRLERYRAEEHSLAWQGTFNDYFEIVSKNPQVARLSHARVFEMIMQPGVHTDGQLFEWITNGYPGSAMPAFRDLLTDEQRWHLVNFIRTLSPPHN